MWCDYTGREPAKFPISGENGCPGSIVVASNYVVVLKLLPKEILQRPGVSLCGHGDTELSEVVV